MKFITWAIVLASLVATRPASACEPLLDLLLFSDEIPGKCPVPTTEPQKNINLCFGGPCHSFDGDKGQFGQLKKDSNGRIEALIFSTDDPKAGNQAIVVRKDNVVCPGSPLIPTQTGAINACDALYKVKGIHPDGQSERSPLCTFDSLVKVNLVTTTVGIPVVDVNGNTCTSRMKPQYWLFFHVCCTPGSVFGNQGDTLDINTSLVIANNGVCSLNPVRPDGSADIIPVDDSQPCI